MKFLTNTYDPYREDAPQNVVAQGKETQAQAWEAKKKWLVDKFIGRPQATEHFTVEQLEGLGMVGVYENC